MSERGHSRNAQFRWLSREFSDLVRKIQASEDSDNSEFDVVIVGSGYGGSIAAEELSGCINPESGQPLKIALLERGKEYLPGMFPSQLSELPRHARLKIPGNIDSGISNEGLFDLRIGTDVNTVIANGLGGGSLINAGVMEIPKKEIFNDQWPSDLRNYEGLLPFYHEIKQRLGASSYGVDNTISSRSDNNQSLKKSAAFKKLAGNHSFRDAAVTIAMQDKTNGANVKLNACKLCGDCATGCNYNAKESLDTNLLINAAHSGVQIYTGATVLRIDHDAGNDKWTLFTAYTNKNLQLRHGPAIEIKSRILILAAGALGSTEILLRSQKNNETLKFSGQLGKHFSTNGDMIAAGFAQQEKVNAVANEDTPPAERHIGPSITSIIDINASGLSDGLHKNMVLEELAIPGPMRWVFKEVYSTANTLEWLGSGDNSRHHHEHPLLDPYAINPTAISHTQVYAAMGDDGANGVLQLNTEEFDELHDGAIEVVWPDANILSPFDAQIRTFRALAKDVGLGGTTFGNPLWQLLPDSMRFLIKDQKGPVLTVHPLGGCSMADDHHQGVVNEIGQVFKHSEDGKKAVYKNLVVLDGSIVPTALCTNPALTISAIALRAIRQLKSEWQLQNSLNQLTAEPVSRPVFRDMEQEIIDRSTAIPTIAEFTERLTGPVDLQNQSGAVTRYIAEITLHYEQKNLSELTQADKQGKLIDPVLRLVSHSSTKRKSYLRIFEYDKWHELRNKNCKQELREELLDDAAELIAPLSGTLTIFKRKSSNSCQRRAQGLWAWTRNRGIRDFWQYAFADKPKSPEAEQKSLSDKIKSGIKRARGAWNLASHAGETRLFEYDLEIHKAVQKKAKFYWPAHNGTAPLRGAKYISYKRPSNPWRQLMEMSVLEMPCLRTPGKKSILSLDNRYMASVGAPLFKIVKQQDQVKALTDLASLALYITRMLFSIHIWSARAPEAPVGIPNRLPDNLPGLPEPEIHEIEVDQLDESPVIVRLTRYRGKSPDAQPVITFHGYSASGTTFAHHSIPEDITRYLHKLGRDVWVADLRTSCGLPTATLPWTFETVGLKDIPAAIDYVFKETGQKIDVLAHCMGALMFSMAVLSARKSADEIITDWDKGFSDDFSEARKAIPERIRSAVFSQVGPLVVFSPRNVFSAYVTTYLRNYLPLENFQFRPSEEPELAEQLMDRLLATLPYPDDEFLRENPAWPPWKRTEYVGTRHRMDALYGRDFKLGNLSDETLRYVDDFFGPLNADTVSQTIHFNRLQMLTNRFGRNPFFSKKSLRECWTFPTMSLHGEENGLSDIATLERMNSEMKQAGRIFKPLTIKGYGHQDCWIGENAFRDVFPKIINFLNSVPELVGQGNEENNDLVAYTPWAGPVLGLAADDLTSGKKIPISLSARPSLGKPDYIVLIPVMRNADKATASKSTWCAVHNNQPLNSNSEIPEDALQIVPVDKHQDSWIEVQLSPVLFNAPAQAVAVLTVHDQSPTLITSNFDENF